MPITLQNISQINLNNKKFKNIMVICNNNIYLNLTINIIKLILKFYHYINAFYIVN